MSLRKKKIKESFDTGLKRYIWSFSWFTKASSEMKHVKDVHVLVHILINCDWKVRCIVLCIMNE